MYPVIFQYKMITITTFGVMLGIAFYCAFLLLERELKLHKKDPELAYRILIVTIPSAIVGAKIAHILENLKEFSADPMGMIFSGAGLSVYGGVLLSLITCYFLVRKYKENYLQMADYAAPAIALGYALGRIGCHVSGDGDYGTVTASLWGTAYPNGIVPSSAAVYPTPLFESFFSFFVCGLLLQLRKKELPTGTIFFLYLILNGLPRFLVEFIRVNPIVAFGLTQAQLVAIGLVIAGGVGLYRSMKLRKA